SVGSGGGLGSCKGVVNVNEPGTEVAARTSAAPPSDCAACKRKAAVKLPSVTRTAKANHRTSGFLNALLIKGPPLSRNRFAFSLRFLLSQGKPKSDSRGRSMKPLRTDVSTNNPWRLLLCLRNFILPR